MCDIVKSEDKLKTFQKEVEDGDCIKKRKIVRKVDFAASKQNIVATCVYNCVNIICYLVLSILINSFTVGFLSDFELI